jgi:hypothetical protein
MPLLNLRWARRRDEHLEIDVSSASQLSSLPPTEESFSAGSINNIDPFVYPEVDTLDDDNQSYDPYLTPLLKERNIGLPNRLKKLPSLSSKSPGRKVEQVATPETMAYESMSESPESIKVISKRPGRSRVCKPSFLEVPVRMKRHHHHPTSQKPSDDTVIVHIEDEPKDVPGLKEREYWNNVANKQLDNNGIVHLRTAEALMQLGSAHMRCEVSFVSSSYLILDIDSNTTLTLVFFNRNSRKHWLCSRGLLVFTVRFMEVLILALL